MNQYINLFIDKSYPDFIDKYLTTKTLTRLKYITQFCGCDYTKLYSPLFLYTRFDHSLVVAHMTWHFTHDKKETIVALLHDVGKGETNPQKWPSHKGHDILGDKLIEIMAKRMHFPTTYTKFARFCALNHMVSHNPLIKVKKQLMQIAIGLHNFPQKIYLQRFIAVMSADIHGRDYKIPMVDENNFNDIARELQDLYDKVSAIKLQTIPEFRELLTQLKTHKISREEFKNQKANLMLNEIKKIQH